MSKAIQAGWLKIKKDGGEPKVVRAMDSVVDIVSQ